MAKQHSLTVRRTRIGLWTVPALLFTAVGCGFPHDRYGSDPMLGSFLRPIAPTPPIFTGGDPGVSPAYDGGARMGIPSPDVPGRTPSLDGAFIVPTFNGSLGIGSGSSNRSGSGGAEASNDRAHRPMSSSPVGAHLIPTGPAADRPAPNYVAAAPTPSSVTPRPFDQHTILTSGSAIQPALMANKPLSPSASMKDPRSVISVEEGRNILQTCGAKSMTMESQPTGEWRFICTMTDGGELRRYEARGLEPIEAVRAVMWQVKAGQ